MIILAGALSWGCSGAGGRPPPASATLTVPSSPPTGRDDSPAKADACTDQDRDGVVDVCDSCPDVPGVPDDGCLAIQTDEGVTRILLIVKFDPDQTVERDSPAADLDELAAALKAPGSHVKRIAIVGYAAATEKHPLGTSEARARRVLDLLAARGVDRTSMEAHGLGARPLVDQAACDFHVQADDRRSPVRAPSGSVVQFVTLVDYRAPLCFWDGRELVPCGAPRDGRPEWCRPVRVRHEGRLCPSGPPPCVPR